MLDKKLIAECVATAGYGTDTYTEEDGCSYECYASVARVISNAAYWAQYESCMSDSLNHDFGLGFNFNTYRLRVYDDGTRQAEKLHT